MCPICKSYQQEEGRCAGHQEGSFQTEASSGGIGVWEEVLIIGEVKELVQCQEEGVSSSWLSEEGVTLGGIDEKCARLKGDK